MGISRFLLRRAWKPYKERSLEVWEGLSESRREMKRFKAPNIVLIVAIDFDHRTDDIVEH